MRKIGFVFGLAALLCLSGCDFFVKNAKEVVVAECYGKYLYESDLGDVVPSGLETMDSLARVDAFIDSWIRQQVLLHKAENSLSKENLDFSKQLEAYRNSLITFSYETQFVDQHLDTVVSEEEIAAYYEQNKENFQLRSTMVRAVYVVLDEQCQHKTEFQKLMSTSDTLLIQNLDIMAMYYAVSSFMEIDRWIRLDELTNVIPIEILNAESFLKRNKFVCLEKDDLTYMVRFEDYLLEESVTPIEIEHDNIKNLILMRRKMALLDEMNASIYEKAQSEHAFEVYVGSSITDNAEN